MGQSDPFSAMQGGADPLRKYKRTGFYHCEINAVDYAIYQGDDEANRILLQLCGKRQSSDQEELYLSAACRGFSSTFIQQFKASFHKHLGNDSP